MKHLLSRDGRNELRRFASSDVVVAFDFDGTLAPIVRNPERALLGPETRRRVRELTTLYPCIVISGRAGSDLRSKVAGLGFRATIGNHGAEPSPGGERYRALVRSWKPCLEEQFQRIPGIFLEDKRLSVSIHYRQVPRRDRARRAILEAVTRLDGARVIEGKQVVNVVPRGSPDKGAALLAQRKRLECTRAIYLGDDETDEDVFRLRTDGRLLTVRVGFRQTSRASYYLRNQPAVGQLIEMLVALRSEGHRRRKGRGKS